MKLAAEPELDGFVDWTKAGWDSRNAAESTYRQQLLEAARVGVTTDGVRGRCCLLYVFMPARLIDLDLTAP